jgi:hypothetical protein
VQHPDRKVLFERHLRRIIVVVLFVGGHYAEKEKLELYVLFIHFRSY